MTTYTLHQGNNIDILKQYQDDHFDSIVTDPPYGIEFLGKDWDSDTGAIETWRQCLRVLKPGGHLLAFSAARTYHHLATNIEAVGFEIRDQIMWIYGSGFPKAQDVGKNMDRRGINNEYHGWKTALKPAHEPIVMARKPMKGSTVDNVLAHGVGALNIDATRVGDEVITSNKYHDHHYVTPGDSEMNNAEYSSTENTGRYPSNVMGEISDYQKYFYCAKVKRSERHMGDADNNHPTVKPVALMNYLVTLITPPQGKVLDPFMGSGSTGMATVEFGGEFTGCELDPNYVAISEQRISAWLYRHQPLSKYETNDTTKTDKC